MYYSDIYRTKTGVNTTISFFKNANCRSNVQLWTSCSKSFELLLYFLWCQLALLRLQQHLCCPWWTPMPILACCSHNYTSLFLGRWGWRRSVCNILDLPLQFCYLAISFIQWSLHTLHGIPHWSVLIGDILSLPLQLVHICSHHVLHLLSLSFHGGSHLFLKASLLFFLLRF